MFRMVCPLCFLLSALAMVAAAPVKETKGKNIKGWGTVIDPDRDCKVAEKDGKVTITVPKTHHDLTYTDDGSKLNAPRLLQFVKGDFQVQVKVHSYPLPQANTSSSGKHSFVSSGLLLWIDDQNFLRLERAAEGSTPAPFIWAELFQNGRPVSQKLKPAPAGAVWLRLVRKQGEWTLSFSGDGDDWTEVLAEEVKLPEKLQVGVLAINTTTQEFAPTLEKFTVQKGN